MKINKKAISGMFELIVFGLIIMILGWGVMNMIFPGIGEAVTVAKTTSNSQLLDACLSLKAKTVTGPSKSICYNCDFDNDGLNDFCDNCPLVNNYDGKKPDSDKDLFNRDCCGNDGNLKWEIDPKTGKWDPKSVHNLPCYNPPAYPHKGGRRDSIVEDENADKDPSRHPLYKNIPLGTVKSYYGGWEDWELED